MNYKIEYVSIDTIKKNPKNPRIIKNEKFDLLIKSIHDCPDMFDARPILISDRTGELIIMGGNMRYEAAKALKMEKVPVIIMQRLTEIQEKEIAIKDNGAWGEWDFDILANEWRDLPIKEWGIEISQFNFIPDENKQIDEDAMAETKNECPKCGFKW